MKKYLFILSAFLLVAASCGRQQGLDLSGTWQVSLDSLETFQPMALPGTTDDAGLGEPNKLEPGITGPQIQRLTRKHSFLGAAFYQREINIPKSMAGRPLMLTLERVIWQSSVWVDGVQLPGAEESLTTAHHYYIPEGLAAGKHSLMLRIDNRERIPLSASKLAHAYTNDTQIIWNGVLGEMSLKALEPVEIAQVDVYPDAAARTARVVTTLVRHDPSIASALLEYRPKGAGAIREEVALDQETVQVEHSLDLGPHAALWDEFSPNLQSLTVRCGKDSRTVSYGLRDFKRAGDHIEINGRRVFLRGTLNCCIYPLTGTPPLDDKGWEKEFKVCKEWGLNHIRFHSWCPPDAAFRVADRLGLYLQVELPDWARNIGTEPMNAFLQSEYDHIIAAYGNHPSFVMLTCGNELDRGYDWLNWMLRYMKEKDPRHIYSNSTYSMGGGHKGYPEPEDEFYVASRTYKGQIRGQDYLDAETPDFTHDFTPYVDFDLPMISHEVGQYSVYPNLAEIKKYTGVLDPLNFKGLRNVMESKGLLDKAPDWTLASGRLSALLYKEEVERALKTPRISGFQLLGLQDFSGQSTALVGLVDAFWDNKGLVTPEWFRQACAPVTPLVRFSTPWWTNDQTFTAGVEIANYSPKDLKADVVWTLKDGSKTIASGVFKGQQLPTGGNTVLDGRIEADLGKVSKAAELTLEVALKGTEWHNSWHVWVYPADLQEDAGAVVLARTLDEAREVLENGGTVLLNPDPATLRGEKGKFVPVFWSPVFFPAQAGPMGILCDPSHPALKEFPTAMHSDWQWWYLAKHATALDLDEFPQVGTILEAVDNFTKNRHLAYILEAKCGEGRLLVCTMDLMGEEAAARPEVRQLCQSLLDYMNSPAFKPEASLTFDDLDSFILKPGDRPVWPFMFWQSE